MKFNVDRHFIYITTCVDENKENLQSCCKLTEEDLEEITKECSTDLLISLDPTELFDIDIPEATQDTPGSSKTKKKMKTKKDEEIQDIDNRSLRTTSISPKKEGNDEEVE